MSEQQSVTDTPTESDVPERLPQRPVDTKAIIMHDTGDKWFQYYVNNAYRPDVLRAYIKLETERETPRNERIGQANTKLMELKE